VIAIAKDRRLRALEAEHSKLKQQLANAKLANAASSLRSPEPKIAESGNGSSARPSNPARIGWTLPDC
jgi:hypothetical protein